MGDGGGDERPRGRGEPASAAHVIARGAQVDQLVNVEDQPECRCEIIRGNVRALFEASKTEDYPMVHLEVYGSYFGHLLNFTLPTRVIFPETQCLSMNK